MPHGKKREGEAMQSWAWSLCCCLRPSPALQHSAGVTEFAFPEVTCAVRRGCCLVWAHGSVHAISAVGFMA